MSKHRASYRTLRRRGRLGALALALGVTIAVVVALVVAVRWLRRPENRERITAWLRAHEHRADVRVALAAWRRARRPARFLWERLTPGNLGLELTTLLSTALVGGYVFFGYMLVLDDVTLTPGDRRAEIWAEAVRNGVLDSLADGAQQLGSLPVVAVAVALTAGGLLMARERLEAFVLLGGLALTIVAAAIADGAIVREALTPGGEAASYPDTGGAYAVTWIALAVALRHATGPFTRSAALAVLGTVLTIAFALASVYVRDDWFSDVAGGIGLGVLCWSVAGVAGLLIRRVD